jgi:ribosomal 50S subunit-associated protein YjgA (DUF615 family)
MLDGSRYDSVMDRATLLDYLQEAQRHVSEGAGRLERQKAIIEELTRDGHDVRQAETLLQAMENLQRMHIEHVALIRKELGQVG